MNEPRLEAGGDNIALRTTEVWWLQGKGEQRGGVPGKYSQRMCLINDADYILYFRIFVLIRITFYTLHFSSRGNSSFVQTKLYILLY